MADNYLERRMEDYRAGKLSVARSARRVVSSGVAKGDLLVHYPRLRVFVAGGAHGIGKSIVKAFRSVDCRVAFIDSDAVAGNAVSQCLGARFYHADVVDQVRLEKCMADIFAVWGDIDVLVNNAEIAGFMSQESDDAGEWQQDYDGNISPALLCARLIAEHRASAPLANSYGGRVINIGPAPSLMDKSGIKTYAAKERVLVSITQELMTSLAKYGITVNSISPGCIQTEDQNSTGDTNCESNTWSRVGKPEDIARVAMFLAVPDNDFINGAIIRVDGGVSHKMI